MNVTTELDDLDENLNWRLRWAHLWGHLAHQECLYEFTKLIPTEISPWIEGKVESLARLVAHKLGVLRKPSLKRLRWAGPVFRDDGSSVYIRIFDNQITPPCDAWREELKLDHYVITPVVTVENHHDFIVMANRSEYRVYQCRICTGAFHVAQTWMWRPIWVKS